MPNLAQAFEGAPWTPRDWQSKAVHAVRRHLSIPDCKPVVSAVMGSGKSVAIAELAHLASPKGQVVVTTPTRKLVRQLGKTLAQRCGADRVGLYFTDAKESDRPVVVCCNASAPKLADELHEPPLFWVADEAHRTESAGILEAHETLQPRFAVGFSATPFRSNQKENLSLWTHVAYRYSPGDALKDGVIVPWRIVNWDGTGDHEAESTRETTDNICVALIREHGEGPGIVSAQSIDDAEGFAGRLRSEDIPAQAIHSELKRAAQEQLLNDLEVGDLRCLVHVSLLAEGVDLPWLRWLCLRRPVGARVRFVQEVGRVLRSYDGPPKKEHAVIIDPFDLFSTFGLSYEEALGWYTKEKGEKQQEEKLKNYAGMPKERMAVAVGAIEGWAKRLLLALQVEGMAKPNAIPYTTWRKKAASKAQIKTLGKMWWACKYLPKGHQKQAEAICNNAGRMRIRKGVASDLLSVIFSVLEASKETRGRRRRWNWPEHLEVEPLPESASEELVKVGEMGWDAYMSNEIQRGE